MDLDSDRVLSRWKCMHNPIDLLIVMLGTNDCTTRYNASAGTIAKGLAQVIQKARKNVSQPFNLLVISPIPLDEGVDDPGFDPEFDEKSVEISKKLAEEYHKVALLHHAAFLDASAFRISEYNRPRASGCSRSRCTC